MFHKRDLLSKITAGSSHYILFLRNHSILFPNNYMLMKSRTWIRRSVSTTLLSLLLYRADYRK